MYSYCNSKPMQQICLSGKLQVLITEKSASDFVLSKACNCMHHAFISINQSIIFNVLGTNRGPTDNQSIQ